MKGGRGWGMLSMNQINYGNMIWTKIRLSQKTFIDSVIFIMTSPTNSSKATIIFIIFWDFLMFYQIFLLSKVKRCATRATSFEKKSIVKSFNFEKLTKIWWKKAFPRVLKMLNTRILETALFRAANNQAVSFLCL